jgi:hypothetical protein
MHARVYRTANQNIAGSTATAVAFDAEEYDVGTLHDNATNPSRITVPVGGDGLWLIIGQLSWEANATGLRQAWVYKNGSRVAIDEVPPDTTPVAISNQVACLQEAVAGDYFELYARQTGAATLAVIGGGLDLASFSAARLF